VILQAIFLKTFAGIQNWNIRFKPGINVVYGPNEAGKSTVFQGITHLLFTPAVITKTVFRKTMEQFLPLTGGEEISGSLSLLDNNEIYEIRKTWGGSRPYAELSFPDGSVAASDEKVKTGLRKLFPLGEQTFRQLCAVNQNRLNSTLEQLKENPEVLHEFQDLLNRALLESGGVSPSNFISRLEELRTEYFKRWSREKSFPEGNRGIRNPYKTGTGIICKAYYEKEGIKEKLREAAEHEAAYQKVCREYESLRRTREENSRFLENNSRLYQKVLNSSQGEAEAAKLGIEISELRKHLERWPVAEQMLLERKKEGGGLEKKLLKLQEEEKNALRRKEQQDLFTLYERVRQFKKILEEKSAALEKKKGPDGNALRKARSLETDREKISARLESGSVSLSVEAKKEFSLDFRTIGETPQSILIHRGEKREFAGEGSIVISTEKFSMEASSGDINPGKLREELEKINRDLSRLFLEYNVQNIRELEKAAAEYEGLKIQKSGAEENLKRELGDFSIEEIEAKARQEGMMEEGRSYEDIVSDRAEVRQQRASVKTEQENLEKETGEYTEKYISRDNLFRRLTELQMKKGEAEKKYVKDDLLPDSFTSAEEFRRKYEEIRQNTDQIQNNYADRKAEKSALESTLPENSVEELEEMAGEAEARFLQAVQYGENLNIIYEESENILSGGMDAALTPFLDSVSGFLRQSTGESYAGIEQNSLLPETLFKKEGPAVPFSLLSAGMKDTFALSLRLAMAGTAVPEAGGFIMLDDPLVDMDPRRRAAAAEIITEFSRKTQVLLFTCHPDHAALFPDAWSIELPLVRGESEER